MTKWIAGLALGGALAFAAPSTAEAQGPIFTGGLVNVTLIDVVDANNNEILNDVNIGVALQLAATVCDVNVAVLAAILGDTGAVDCTNGPQTVTITQATRPRGPNSQ